MQVKFTNQTDYKLPFLKQLYAVARAHIIRSEGKVAFWGPPSAMFQLHDLHQATPRCAFIGLGSAQASADQALRAIILGLTWWQACMLGRPGQDAYYKRERLDDMLIFALLEQAGITGTQTKSKREPPVALSSEAILRGEIASIDARAKSWDSKLRRAQNALKKLERTRKLVEKKLAKLGAG